MTEHQRLARNAAMMRWYRKHRDRIIVERNVKHANRTDDEKQKHRERRKRYELKDPEAWREAARKRRKTDKYQASKKASDQICRDRVRQYARDWAAKNKEQINAKNREKRWNLRLEVIAAYGGHCACCGEDDPHFLTIDHIYNDGASERRKNQHGCGDKFYMWLRRRGWPKGRHQVLCSNCNSAKGQFGKCPHEAQLSRTVGAEI